MNGNFAGFHPKVVEIFPDTDFLLDELFPLFWEFNEVAVSNAHVVGPRAHHVEKRGHAVQGVSYQQQHSLSVKFGVPITLWVMRFDDPDPLIDEAFSGEAHEHEIFVELFKDVTIAAWSQPHDLFEVSAQESVSWAWVRSHDHRILVLSFL